MNKKIDRNYLEIYSIEDLIESNSPSNEFKIELINPPNFHLNKFFYKNIGKNHSWIDRLVWNEKQWIEFRELLTPLIIQRYGYERIFLFAQQKPPYKKQRRLLHGDALREGDSEKRTFDDARKEAMHQYIFNNLLLFFVCFLYFIFKFYINFW